MKVDFDRDFEKLTDFPPFEWQRCLYHDYISEGRIPSALDIPTGLGKTSVMVIWYLALRAGAVVPRRLVYVVDRRAVVDQATTVADEIREKDTPVSTFSRECPSRGRFRAWSPRNIRLGNRTLERRAHSVDAFM